MHALRIELVLDFILPPMREGLGAEVNRTLCEGSEGPLISPGRVIGGEGSTNPALLQRESNLSSAPTNASARRHLEQGLSRVESKTSPDAPDRTDWHSLEVRN